jgi:hypothetical protein
MVPALLAALALTAPSLAQDDDGGFTMNDLGGAVRLPAGYASELWTDAELKAKHPQGRLFKLWLTPWQVEVDDAASKAWAEKVQAGLEAEGVKEVGLTTREVRTIAGRRTAWMAYELSIGGGRGVAYAAAFTARGHVAHLRVVAGARFAKQAEADLVAILEQLALKDGPLETQAGTLTTAAGFSATLPDGWRAPLRDELDLVRGVTKKVGEEGLAPDDCWVAVKPPAVGDPDVLFACRSQYYIGPLDEHSFAGVEAEVHERWFGRADKPVPAAEQVTVGDRVGLLYQPPVATHAVRLALAPYDGGMMVLWGLAGNLDEPGLDAAVRAVLPTVAFTGPDGGRPIIGADKWAAYYLTYRPTSPLVWGPALLLVGLVGGGIAASRRKRPELDDA